MRLLGIAFCLAVNLATLVPARADPSLTRSQSNRLIVAFPADDSSDRLWLGSFGVDPNNPVNFDTKNPALVLTDSRIGSAPAVTVFNNRLLVAFKADDSSDRLWLGSFGNDLESPTLALTDSRIGGAPAVTVFNNRLLVAFKADDSSDRLWLGSFGNDLKNITLALTNSKIGSAPTVTVFNNRMLVAFKADDSSDRLWLGSFGVDPDNPVSLDTKNPTLVLTDSQIGSAPAVTVFNNRLIVAFRADDSSHRLWLASFGNDLKNPTLVLTDSRIGSAPALSVFNNRLIVAFRADDSSHRLWLASFGDDLKNPTLVLTDSRIGPPDAPAPTASSVICEIDFAQAYLTDPGVVNSGCSCGCLPGSRVSQFNAPVRSCPSPLLGCDDAALKAKPPNQ